MRLTVPAILFLSTILICSAQAQYPRLRRPERFDTAEQISNYLKELQEYYSVHGRGRYGKRQMHIADASVIFRETPLFDHNMDQDGIFKKLGYNKYGKRQMHIADASVIFRETPLFDHNMDQDGIFKKLGYNK